MKKALSYGFVILNALISAFVYHLFVYPNNFAPAGIGGICTMIQYVFGINVGYLNLLINVPLAIAVYFLVSKALAKRGLLYVAAFSGFLVLLSYVDLTAFEYYTENGTSTILGPLVGGLIMGYLNALMVRIGAVQAGAYFIGCIVRRFRKDFNVFWITFAINAGVAVISYFVYGMKLEPVLLCILYCFSTSMVSNMVAKGDRSAIRFEIVTDKPQELSRDIIEKLHHSATLLPGKGIYQGKETSVLVCIVNNVQAAQLAALIRSYPNTFASMSQVSEVMGNFKHLDVHGNPEKHILDAGDNDVIN